jgi:hypothetical protein
MVVLQAPQLRAAWVDLYVQAALVGALVNPIQRLEGATSASFNAIAITSDLAICSQTSDPGPSFLKGPSVARTVPVFSGRGEI